MDKKHVEAALFVAKIPMTIGDIAKIVGEDEKVVLRWILELKDEYKNRGMIIKQIAGGFEMVSSPDCIDVVQQIVPKQYESLSRSAEETLAIIAYKQPVKRSVIAKMRGVLNPDHGLVSLIDRHLISETEEGFVTTDQFLHFYAINDLKELPEVIIETSFAPENAEEGTKEVDIEHVVEGLLEENKEITYEETKEEIDEDIK